MLLSPAPYCDAHIIHVKHHLEGFSKSFDCFFKWMLDMIVQRETDSWMILSETRPHQGVLSVPSVSLSLPFAKCSPYISQTSWECINEISLKYLRHFANTTTRKTSWFLICLRSF